MEKTFSGQNLCSAPTSVLTQNKGPDTEPHFSNPPPLLWRASMSPPPPPPQSNFQAALWVRIIKGCNMEASMLYDPPNAHVSLSQNPGEKGT